MKFGVRDSHFKWQGEFDFGAEQSSVTTTFHEFQIEIYISEIPSN
jgi:hypothetical protein